MVKQKIPKSAALLPASRPKGIVTFYPHERLDEASLRLVRRFRVRSFGNIQDHSRHIPYNSGKKDFFEKTGRESFEGKERENKTKTINPRVMIAHLLTRMQSSSMISKYPETITSIPSCGITMSASSA